MDTRTAPLAAAEGDIAESLDRLGAAQAEVRRVLVGQDETIDLAFACLIAGGHVLLEDAPGTGKTTLARALARAAGLGFARVQMTADMLPVDVTGGLFPTAAGPGEAPALAFRPGPIFAAIVLADELNRTPPRTQSALLEAMAEGAVTADGETRPLPEPFFVVATQNPLEFAGTYPLPESQLDRFAVRLAPGYPTRDAEARMLRARRGADPLDEMEARLDASIVLGLRARAAALPMSAEVEDDLLAIVRATRDGDTFALGASPRATLDLDRVARALALIAGRDFVSPDDVRRAAVPVLSHRVVLTDGAPDDAAQQRDAIASVLASIPAPRIAAPAAGRAPGPSGGPGGGDLG